MRARYGFMACSLIFVAGCSALPAPGRGQAETVTITVDAAANRHPISPDIYGVAYADTKTLLDLNAPVHRYGGNNTTRYNWKLNADNRAADWFFESIGDESATPGERVDTFIAKSRAAKAQPMVTIPIIDWVAKLGPSREKLASFSVKKYGAQQKTDQYMPDAGNGVKTDGKNLTGNDPADANVRSSVEFQTEWVKHLVSKWGPAARGGLRYYILDNEYSIWQGTHRDVQPVGATMDEIGDKIVAFSKAIKQADPGALVAAPEEWGWTGYLYSGYDSQWGGQHGWGDKDNLPDRKKHGGMDYLPWLLDHVRKQSDAAGKRLLDVFTVHIYPQGGEFGNDTSAAMQLRRNRSTRALWDPSYKDETWIADTVQLIPRIKGWVAKYYPGTKTGITEYNWGAEDHINGATAQADILGILGREGLDIACRWTTPEAKTPTYKAMKLYRNYDDRNGAFGETSVKTTVPNPDEVSAFAAVRAADGALTVVVVNKRPGVAANAEVGLSNFRAGRSAQAWQLTSANAITHLPDVAVSAGRLRTNLPAQSITLFVVPAAR